MSSLDNNYFNDCKVNDFEFVSIYNNREDVSICYDGYWKGVFKRFIKQKKAAVVLIILSFICILALFGPMVSGYTYSEQSITQQNMAPSKSYWFGSDDLGRDIWTRVWTGTRISLYMAILAVIIDLFIGMIYGLISGYFGGKIDFIMQRFVEVINSIPTLVIVTLLLIVLKPGLSTITLSLIITGWIGMSRVARAQAIKNKDLEYVLAAKILGVSKFSIIIKEILPNIIGQLMASTIFSISDAIFTEAFLSFVGLGVPAPMASLGSLISDGYNSFMVHPYQLVSPVLVLVILMLSFSILADSIHTALEPGVRA